MNEQKRPRSRDWRIPFLGISLLVIVLDRVTKIWVNKHVVPTTHIVIIPHVFSISHVLNPGAAFSLFTDSADPQRTHLLLTGFSILASVVVFGVLMFLGRKFTMTGLALALILGGAVGNLWDRLAYKEVTDFIAVTIIHYHWPDFNLADSSIVIGGILLMLDAIRNRKEHHGAAEDGAWTPEDSQPPE
ncbi:MAG: signal peptidase II [Acidobacteria bacterium]|jgi:signal peptidase II|nr:signal peptidase II [Acidobacteriota bacterium]